MNDDAIPPSTRAALTGLAKGHGTGNSFLVYVDEDGTAELSPAEVARLCSPAFGIGADGLMRALRVDGRWFMDYRNADGSLAEMCGNGIRVFTDHLRREGLLEGPRADIGTRGGVRSVEILPRGGGEADYRVDMGPARTSGEESIRVTVPGLEGARLGIFIDMPNPHTVIACDSEAELAALVFPTTPAETAPASLRPSFDPVNPRGTNLEAVVDLGDEDGRGLIRMRVLERGVGETLSCGTGCCAAALAAAIRRGEGAPTAWTVLVPGGRVGVELEGVLRWHGSRAETTSASVLLTGPATRIARIDGLAAS